MHVDYLSVTMNEVSHSEVLESLTPIIATLGITSAYQGLYKLHTGGTLKTGVARGATYHVSASGDFLLALRAESLYQDYLAILALVPHRVTRMDIAHDQRCDAPKSLMAFKRRVESGEVRITRNKLDLQTQYNSVLSRDRFGNESGTVYVGPKSVQTAGLKVYDKSKERYDKARLEIPSTLRWELKLGRKSEISLRDAWEPDPVFWHYMSALLPAPDGVPHWEPHGSSFTLPRKVTLLPAESMRRLLESSDIVPRLFTLCDQVGAHGFDHLVRLLANARQSHTINQPNSEASSDGAQTGS